MQLLANLDFFEQGINAAESISNSWDNQWSNVLGLGGSLSGTTLYGVIADVGVYSAVATLLAFMLIFFKNLNEGKPGTLADLIWPIIVIFFLANNGERIATFTLDLRNFINDVNEQVLTITVQGVKLDEAYRQLQGMTSTQEVISSMVKQCEALTGEKQIECLDGALQQSEQLLQDFQTTFGAASWVANQLDNIGNILSSLQNAAGIPGIIAQVSSLALINPFWEGIVFSVLLAFQMAFQNTLEASMLLTALLGPMAMGGSLLPVGSKPIFAWLTGFFSLGVAKLSFNIISGVTAVTMLNASITDPLWFPIFVGIFAPVVSSALAAGGGLAIWSSITSTYTSIVKLAAGPFSGLIR